MIKKRDLFRGVNKAGIIAEYLSHENTFESLGKKYSIPGRTIQSWVRAYRKANLTDISHNEATLKEQELCAEVERLKLKNELLEEILKLSEEQTGIDLKKKYGAKRS